MMSEFNFSNVWAYAFSYASRDFLYDREWDGRVVEGSSDSIIVGRVENYNEIIEIRDSKFFDLDDFEFFKIFYSGSNKDLIKGFYEESNPDFFKDRRFKLEDVFGQVCFDERIERVKV